MYIIIFGINNNLNDFESTKLMHKNNNFKLHVINLQFNGAAFLRKITIPNTYKYLAI